MIPQTSLLYIIYHVFLPPVKLPQQDDFTQTNDQALAEAVADSSKQFLQHLEVHERGQIARVINMLRALAQTQEYATFPISDTADKLQSLHDNESLAFLIRAQNAGVIVHRRHKETIFETFEASPQNQAVVGTVGKLICSYPGPSVSVDYNVVQDRSFCRELASFLSQMNNDILDSAATTTKASSTMVEERDTAHPRYITELLIGILEGHGQRVTVPRFAKRIGDEVQWLDAELPWRRSPLWLVIRVAIQAKLYHERHDHILYKIFVTFFMVQILRQSLEYTIESDVLFCMRAKLARRLQKLGDKAPGFLVQTFKAVASKVQAVLEQRVKKVQDAQAHSSPWAPDRLDIARDCHLTLPNSRPYLLSRLKVYSDSSPTSEFVPKPIPRLDSNIFSETLLHDLTSSTFPMLADFESMVHRDLLAWTQEHLHQEESCAIVAECIKKYLNTARPAYKGSPEDESIMLLTVFFLWMALDKMVIAQIPLLVEYSPEIPVKYLEPLLIRKSPFFSSLSIVVEHLRMRHAKSSRTIFSDETDSQTFSVRFCSGSAELRRLKAKIEEDAMMACTQKSAELQSKNQEYHRLVEEAANLDHEYAINWRGHEYHRQNICSKCFKQRSANSMTIDVHEWPLPKDNIAAQAVVFELQCPTQFRIWREMTYTIMNDVCGRQRGEKVSPPMHLDRYDGLARYRRGSHTSRILYASTTKSFCQSHYKNTRLPTQGDSVCVNNGLSWRLFDTENSQWVTEAAGEDNVHSYCTIKLESHSVGGLKRMMQGLAYSSNEVIALQSTCPFNFNLHQFDAFGLLRSGGRTQWLNILRELRTLVLPFDREEVLALFLQAAFQAGPCSEDGSLEWHHDLTTREFGLALLQELDSLLSAVQTNWLMTGTVALVTLLTSRLLASASEADVLHALYSVLYRARDISFVWLNQLITKLQGANNNTEIMEFQRRLYIVAATCRLTFDVDEIHLRHVLKSQEDISTLFECAVRFRDNAPSSSSEEPATIQILLARDRRFSHFLERFLSELLPQRFCQMGIDAAIKSIWPAYSSSQPWTHLSSVNTPWIHTQTLSTSSFGIALSQDLHLNLLDGQFLINGHPVARLPREITSHSTYKRILGDKVLEVIPTRELGMSFVTREHISDHQVFFSMKGDDLYIRAKRNDKAFELIPPFRMRSATSADLPSFLLNDYAHWMELPEGKQEALNIELRPIEFPWLTSQSNWTINFSPMQTSRTCMYKYTSNGRVYIVDNFSSTFRMISACVTRLEQEENMLVTYSPNIHGPKLVVQLPRYKLSFFENDDGQLQCNEMVNMVFDFNQSIGTFIGLENALVLRLLSTSRTTRLRRIIVPFGKVCFQSNAHSLLPVKIDTSRDHRVHYEVYTVDDELGRLLGSSTLKSKLYAVLLHAYTSQCIVDSLTGHTGVEEALQLLQSAGCFSFQKLTQEEIQILSEIATLTPRRSHYPAHLRVMESIVWSDLPALSQHCDFSVSVRRIVDFAQSLAVFNSEDTECIDAVTELTKLTTRNTLQVRARSHSRALFPVTSDSTWPQDMGRDEDRLYEPRHRFSSDNSGLQSVRQLSAWIHVPPAKLPTSRCLLQTLIEWHHIEGCSGDLSLSYDRTWMSHDPSEVWLSLYNACRKSCIDQTHYQLLFSFSAMVYSNPQWRAHIPTILSFAIQPSFRPLTPPHWDDYDLSIGFSPNKDQLTEVARSCAISFQSSTFASLMKLFGESDRDHASRCANAFDHQCHSDAQELVSAVVGQWPCQCPTATYFSSSTIDVADFMSKAQPKFLCWFKNRELKAHVEQVQVHLNEVYVSIQYTTVNHSPCNDPEPSSITSLPDPMSFARLLRERRPPAAYLKPLRLSFQPKVHTKEGQLLKHCIPNLLSLLEEFESGLHPKFYREYSAGLRDSCQALLKQLQNMTTFSDVVPMHLLIEYRDRCKNAMDWNYGALLKLLSPAMLLEDIVFISGLWPRITKRTLLQLLSSVSCLQIDAEWKATITAFALDVLRFQRSQRLVHLHSIGLSKDIHSELANDIMSDSEALENPDWLLIQVDGDFTIRPVQKHIASYMTDPFHRDNTVLQLNMGEGKSSVIVPVVAATLADGRSLVRIVVLKPLAIQMFQLLVQRLSGLANRRIFYFPFSRKINVTSQKAQSIQGLYKLCSSVQGLLVAQPEHILSFKLMGIDLSVKAALESSRTTRILVDTQLWLDRHSKDILDESDEILHVKYQLVYAAGRQICPEDHPDRWTTTQQVLRLVKKHGLAIHAIDPQGIDIHQEHKHGSFPMVRVLRADASQALLTSVARDIIRGHLPNLAFGQLPIRVQEALQSFITSMDVSDQDAGVIRNVCDGGVLWKGLLLLRGLLARGVLSHVLMEKRWRVDYGLCPNRTLLAVPYRAKDVPSVNADFGHPDVTIALTCLSYHYGGLTEEQLDLCFRILFKLDNPSMEYEKWIADTEGIPEFLRDVVGVNLEDSEQKHKYLLPHFSFNMSTIDFYLSNVVFPKASKEFTKKLATSPWDLAASKNLTTVGFSGTKDNQYLLPTSIHQVDPVNQSAVNAMVLAYLLKQENGSYLCYGKDGDAPLGARVFLDLLRCREPPIQVLLDVGAQMIDMTNLELSKCWLSIEEQMQACVFFTDDDVLSIVTRDGVVEPLNISSFNQRLDQCLVYLDDAHTRGIDLKLPVHYRAAVTLGPKMAKDRLLQGCMRMRRLGKGQSVMFFAPQEVDHMIRSAMVQAGKDAKEVTSVDILRWTILYTCENIQHHLPNWFQQGRSFARRDAAWSALSKGTEFSLDGLRSTWLEDDSKTLEQLYGLSSDSSTCSTDLSDAPPQALKHLEFCGVSPYMTSGMDEEQERELSHEIEREAQLERPPPAVAATHKLSPGVRTFVQTGILPSEIRGTFAYISNTFLFDSESTASCLWGKQIVVTKDFTTTIQGSKDLYHLRQVQWILSSIYDSSLVLISPHEANELLPEIRASKAVHLHVYAPRVTKIMKSLEDLTFFAIPPLPSGWVPPDPNTIMRLNLWSGQLYLNNYQIYQQLCMFLGLYTKELKDQFPNIVVQTDGFIKPEDREGAMRECCSFGSSPLPTLKEFFALRRKGISFLGTHMGKILQARLLMEDDF